MAGSLTDVAEVDLLKLLTGQATTVFTTTPITPHVGLFTTAPTETSAGTEATGGGYARANSSGQWGTPAAGQVQNSGAITYNAFTGTVSTGSPFVAFGIFTAPTGGTLVTYGDLTIQTKTGAAGDQIAFAPGALTITAD